MIILRKRPLPDNAWKVLDAIEAHWVEQRFGPSIRNIMARAGFTSHSIVTWWLDETERLGLILRTREVARSIRLSDAGAWRSRSGTCRRRRDDDIGDLMLNWHEALIVLGLALLIDAWRRP